VLGVLDLWRRAEGSRSSTESAEDVGGLLLRDPEALLLAETEEGEIVGSLIVGWNGWRGTFYRMAVDPTHRRRGLATALVRAGEERLRALGAAFPRERPDAQPLGARRPGAGSAARGQPGQVELAELLALPG